MNIQHDVASALRCGRKLNYVYTEANGFGRLYRTLIKAPIDFLPKIDNPTTAPAQSISLAISPFRTLHIQKIVRVDR